MKKLIFGWLIIFCAILSSNATHSTLESNDIEIFLNHPCLRVDENGNPIQDGSIDLNINGGSAPYTVQYLTYLSDEFIILYQQEDILYEGGGEDLDGLDVGTYYVKVIDNLCNEVNLEVELKEPEIELDFELLNSCGEDDGSISLQIVAENPVTVEWNTGEMGLSQANLSPGEYIITVTDGNGCNVRKSFLIEEEFNIDLDGSYFYNVNCEKIIRLDIEGCSYYTPYTFEWIDLENGEDYTSLYPKQIEGQDCDYAYPEPSTYLNIGTRSGQYKALISKGHCSEEFILNVLSDEDETNLINQVLYNAYVQNSFCSNESTGSIKLNDVDDNLPHLRILWNSNNGHQILGNKFYVHSLPPGEYCATLYFSPNTYTAHCSSEITRCWTIESTVDINSEISHTINYHNCFGDLTVNHGNGLPWYIEWENSGLSGFQINDLPFGTYCCTISHLFCSEEYCFTIENPNAPELSVTSDVKNTCPGCNNGSIELDKDLNDPNRTYQWSTGETSKIVEDLISGDYFVTVSDALTGCSRVEKFEIIPLNCPERLEIDELIQPLGCGSVSNCDGAIYLKPIANRNVTYEWFRDGQLMSGNSTSYRTGLCSGQYRVKLLINDCLRDVINISLDFDQQNSLIAVESITNPEFCHQNNGSITLTNLLNIPLEFVWSPSVAGNESTANNLPPGRYTVTASSGDCEQTLIIDVCVCNGEVCEGSNLPFDLNCTTLDPKVIVNHATNHSSLDGSISISNVDTNDPNLSVQWSGPNGYTSTQLIIDNLNPGLYEYVLTDGCYTISEEVWVQNEELCEYAIWDYDIEKTCVNNSGTTHGKEGTIKVIMNDLFPYSFEWSNGEQTQEIQVSEPGVYRVTITNEENGCQIEEEVILSEKQNDFMLDGSSWLDCYHELSTWVLTSQFFVFGTEPYKVVWTEKETEKILAERTLYDRFIDRVLDKDCGYDFQNAVFVGSDSYSMIATVTDDCGNKASYEAIGDCTNINEEGEEEPCSIENLSVSKRSNHHCFKKCKGAGKTFNLNCAEIRVQHQGDGCIFVTVPFRGEEPLFNGSNTVKLCSSKAFDIEVPYGGKHQITVHNEDGCFEYFELDFGEPCDDPIFQYENENGNGCPTLESLVVNNLENEIVVNITLGNLIFFNRPYKLIIKDMSDNIIHESDVSLRSGNNTITITDNIPAGQYNLVLLEETTCEQMSQEITVLEIPNVECPYFIERFRRIGNDLVFNMRWENEINPLYYRIYNPNGKLVLDKEFPVVKDKTEYNLRVEHFIEGDYRLVVSNVDCSKEKIYTQTSPPGVTNEVSCNLSIEEILTNSNLPYEVLVLQDPDSTRIVQSQLESDHMVFTPICSFPIENTNVSMTSHEGDLFSLINHDNESSLIIRDGLSFNFDTLEMPNIVPNKMFVTDSSGLIVIGELDGQKIFFRRTSIDYTQPINFNRILDANIFDEHVYVLGEDYGNIKLQKIDSSNSIENQWVYDKSKLSGSINSAKLQSIDNVVLIENLHDGNEIHLLVNGAKKVSTRLKATDLRIKKVLSNENIIIAGDFEGTLEVNNQTFPSNGERDIFLLKLSDTGYFTNVSVQGSPNYECINSADLTDNKDIVVGGDFTNSTTLGGITFLSDGDTCTYITTITFEAECPPPHLIFDDENCLLDWETLECYSNALSLEFLGEADWTEIGNAIQGFQAAINGNYRLKLKLEENAYFSNVITVECGEDNTSDCSVCSDCIDCPDCPDCTTRCEDCIDCIECPNCPDCQEENCESCSNCNLCPDCPDCITYCETCTYCTECPWCPDCQEVDCNSCTDCNECPDCPDCQIDCNTCTDCNECPDCPDCQVDCNECTDCNLCPQCPDCEIECINCTNCQYCPWCSGCEPDPNSCPELVSFDVDLLEAEANVSIFLPVNSALNVSLYTFDGLNWVLAGSQTISSSGPGVINFTYPLDGYMNQDLKLVINCVSCNNDCPPIEHFFDTFNHDTGNDEDISNRNRNGRGLIIYPNPSNHNFTADISVISDMKGVIKVKDISGKIIFTDDLYLGKGKNRYLFAESHKWMAGVYFVIFKSDELTISEKILKVE